MISLLAANFAAGLVATPHCVGMCGPFACRGGAAWHVGKLATYAVLGALAGAFGALLRGPDWLAPVVGVTLLGLSALRLAGVIELRAGSGGTLVGWGRTLAGRSDTVGRVLLGALSGLLPCGMVHAALALPVVGRDPVWGAVLMIVFGVGTAPGLFASQRVLAWLGRQRPLMRKLVAATVFTAGVVAVALRSPLLAPAGSEPVCHPQPTEGKP